MDTKQPEALRLTEIARYCFRSEGLSDPPEQSESPTGDMVDYFDHVEIEKELLARIAALESQLAQRFDAADMATAAAQGAAYAALPEPYCNAHDDADACYPDMFSEQQMRAFADATCALRASHGQAPAQPDPAYSEACNLATALFKKHFAHLPDYASGQAVWGLFDSTVGVILQIDNMVAGLVQPPTPTAQADSVLNDACHAPPLGWRCTRKAGHEGPCAAVEYEDDKLFVDRGMQRIRDAEDAAQKEGE